MIRSYSLTFAAVTTRLISPLAPLLTHDALLSVNISIWSWTLNLLVAEWLIRRYTHQLEKPYIETVRATAASALNARDKII